MVRCRVSRGSCSGLLSVYRECDKILNVTLKDFDKPHGTFRSFCVLRTSHFFKKKIPPASFSNFILLSDGSMLYTCRYLAYFPAGHVLDAIFGVSR